MDERVTSTASPSGFDLLRTEIVGEAGLRFKAGDSEALYACLRDIIEIPSLRASLSVAARRRAMQIFDRNSMIEGHVSAYREALHR